MSLMRHNHMRLFRYSFLLLICLTLSSLACAVTPDATIKDVMQVVYPADQDVDDPRFMDVKETLRVALEKTIADFGPFSLRPSNQRTNGLRYFNDLANGNELNVAWSSTSIEKERNYLPIRIPLRKGLLSYRIALIRKDKQALLDHVQTLEDLKKFTIGQGVGWDDAKLYRANGIEVIEAKYSNLFRMLDYQRFDLFPRGIGEVFTEFEKNHAANPNLAIEENLLIYYPWPYYFFVSKNNPILQRRIETGLRRMIKDGSFDAIFWKYNAKAIESVNFKKRRLIQIKNHLLPKETPLQDESLWFKPKMN